ncbi:hypothetical protein [Burkholderia cepacia]|uniref:hypothetical protein n=1 Tax=Burkholderia cepacia TaxID=292 RepID=UPI001588EC9D|nr:hypothetical protein [Burkholderia cepacia]
MDGDERQGFEDTLALWVRVNMFEGGEPMPDVWDPLKKLEDAEHWRENLLAASQDTARKPCGIIV